MTDLPIAALAAFVASGVSTGSLAFGLGAEPPRIVMGGLTPPLGGLTLLVLPGGRPRPRLG